MILPTSFYDFFIYIFFSDTETMKVVTPEILWHDREPIYSVDLQPLSGNFQRLASCGVDKIVRVRLWAISHINYDYVSAGHFMYVFHFLFVSWLVQVVCS